MLIPYNSDAPLYHPPIATVGLIVVNLLLFFAWPPYEPSQEALIEQFVQRMNSESSEEMTDEEIERIWREVATEAPAEVMHPDWRMLHLGNGLRPWQWLTANFMHADFSHVLGNMIFLWAIGLVVEGKLGWAPFLGIYLAIGTVGYGFVQVCMLWGYGNALGASLPIYGILVLALLWAPLNSLNCFIYFFRPMLVEVPIYFFAGGYLVMQVAFFLFSGMSMGSEALHLIGAFVAFPIGLVMLQRKLVDCEDWDIISVWKGRHELSREERRQLDEAKPEFQAKVVNHQEAYLGQINAILSEQKNPALAWAAHLKAKHRFSQWTLPEPTAKLMIQLFLEQKKYDEALPPMIEYLRDNPAEQTADVRIVLAHRMITAADRPRQGLKLLAPLQDEHLSDAQKQKRAKLMQLAAARKQEIEFEEPTEDW